jgi:hypothetical protein
VTHSIIQLRISFINAKHLSFLFVSFLFFFTKNYSPSHGLQSLDRKLNSGIYGLIDPYDILADVCYETSLSKRIRFPNPTMEAVKNMKAALAELQGDLAPRDVPSRPACIGDYVSGYLNVSSSSFNLNLEYLSPLPQRVVGVFL